MHLNIDCYSRAFQKRHVLLAMANLLYRLMSDLSETEQKLKHIPPDLHHLLIMLTLHRFRSFWHHASLVTSIAPRKTPEGLLFTRQSRHTDGSQLNVLLANLFGYPQFSFLPQCHMYRLFHHIHHICLFLCLIHKYSHSQFSRKRKKLKHVTMSFVGYDSVKTY